MTTVDLSPVAPVRRVVLQRRIRHLVAATITYNVVEAVVAITAGIGASSAALIGFGLDSTIEVASATAVAWQFTASNHEARERTALRIIAVSFFALAGYVAFEALRALLGAGEAQPSTPGLVLAGLSLAIMPVLSWAQRRAGTELGSLDRGGRLEADLAVHLSVGGVARGPGAQQPVRLELGRPDRRARHRRPRRPRRPRSLAR